MNDEKRKGRVAATPPIDNPDWTEEDFARAKPASELLGKEAAALLVPKRGDVRPSRRRSARSD